MLVINQDNNDSTEQNDGKTISDLGSSNNPANTNYNSNVYVLSANMNKQEYV